MEVCDGSGTVEHVALRHDAGAQPLPCPVCGGNVRTEGKGDVRVYAIHERVEW